MKQFTTGEVAAYTAIIAVFLVALGMLAGVYTTPVDAAEINGIIPNIGAEVGVGVGQFLVK